MNIYAYLKNDHQKVSELFEKVFSMPRDNADDIEDQESVFEELAEELLLHTESEQKSFYQALATDMKKAMAHAHSEHDQITALIQKINTLFPEENTWIEHIKRLKELVDHHVQEEEGPIFEQAQAILTEQQACDLVTDMEELKKSASVL